VYTAGPAAALALTVDRAALRADARDVAHVTVQVVDAAGHVVPDADPRVRFDVQGTGSLLGVDNGDPASHESFRATDCRAFHGLGLAMVRAGAAAGEIRVTVSADGLQGANAILHTTAVDAPPSRITR